MAEIDLNTDYSDVDVLENVGLFDPNKAHDHDVLITKPGGESISQEEVEILKKDNEELKAKIVENNDDLQQAKLTIDGITDLLKKSIANSQEKDSLLEQLQSALDSQKNKMESLELLISHQENELKLLNEKALAANVDLSTAEPTTLTALTPQRTNRRRLKPFCVGWDDVKTDDEESRAIRTTMDKPLIVTGCAGSGKSIIALFKAQQLQEAGYSYYVIVFNRTLKAYMSAGFEEMKLTGRVYTRQEWDYYQHPMADYVIIDEAQDFTLEEIKSIRTSAKKQVFMFGDTNQSVYQNLKATTTIEKLATEFDVIPIVLHNCYRLPKTIAALLPYVLKDVEYIESRYKNENVNVPYVLHLDSYEEQLRVIQEEIITKGRLKEVGILLPNNAMVKDFAARLVANGLDVEMRYKGNDVAKEKEFDTLNFNTHAPKIMTYHSAKGLQFETVIIPLCPSFESAQDLKLLYVAMTRSYRNLYIMYSGQTPTPINKFDANLYKNSLSL